MDDAGIQSTGRIFRGEPVRLDNSGHYCELDWHRRLDYSAIQPPLLYGYALVAYCVGRLPLSPHLDAK